MDRTGDTQIRHSNRLSDKNDTVDHSGWKFMTGLFIIQFLLSQLFLSYGVYSVYLIEEQTPLHRILWAPLVLLSMWRISKPWCQDIAETFTETCFRSMFCFGSLICVIGVAANYFSSSFVFCLIFYGGFGGFGMSMILCLIESKIFDIYQYNSTVIQSMKHLSTALGLFITPHLINIIFYFFCHTKFIYLYHGIMLLHIIPASFLLGKSQIVNRQRISRNSFFANFTNKTATGLIDKTIERSWKSPSDKLENVYKQHEDIEHEIPAPHQKCTLGVEVMPEILEENEEELEEDSSSNNKKSVLINDNIKRLSVISTKLDELIEKEETENKPEIVLNVNQTSDANINTENIQSNAFLFKNKKRGRRKSLLCCCSPYQKFHYKKRLKFCCDCIIETSLKPLVTSSSVFSFYPCLLSVIHSMLSPLCFLNLAPVLANANKNFGNMTEISFILSITAFAYICFLITLPWIVDISKRKLRYFYIIGLGISATALYLIKSNHSHNYMTISCLIYGFGFGIESYCLDIVTKEYLGVKNFTKTEGTLNSLSGIALAPILVLINNFYTTEDKEKYTRACIGIIMYSHLFIMTMWIVFPTISDCIYYIKNKRRDKNRYSFMQHL